MTTAIIWSLSSIVVILILFTIFVSTTILVVCILKARKRKKRSFDIRYQALVQYELSNNIVFNHYLSYRRPSQFELTSHANDYAFNGLIFNSMCKLTRTYLSLSMNSLNFVAEETKTFEIDATNPHLANCLITASNLDLKEKIGQGSIGK